MGSQRGRRLLALPIIALALVGACGGGGGNHAAKTVHITYEFQGTDGGQVSYTTATGTEQKRFPKLEDVGVDLPAGVAVSSSVEIETSSEDAECVILDSHGKVLSDNKAHGLHSKATCTATAA